MIVVVASRHDQSAKTFVTKQSDRCVGLLTCEDLSTTGWQYYLNNIDASRAVVSGEIVSCAHIKGVLTRRPAIIKEELQHIEPEDRQYVAAEMHAFLLAWLSSLRCPVINLPAGTSLSGPQWRPEQWTSFVARLDIPVMPWRRRESLTAGMTATQVTANNVEVVVVGDRWFGNVTTALGKQSVRIAQAAGVSFLSLTYSSPDEQAVFLQASLWPTLDNEEVVTALFDYFRIYSTA
jgi:hypothetical protein